MLLAMRIALVLMVVGVTRGALGAGYVAFSLKQAQLVLAEGNGVGPEVRDLAGITRLVGVVVDSNTTDVILVGVVERGVQPLTLDELVVALRARMVHGEWPLVSLDNTPESKAQGLQKVRFAGKIEDTAFGKQLLDADVVLKRLALGKQGASIWGVRSYSDLCEEAAAKGDDSQASVLFWFFPMKTRLLVQPGVFAVASCSVGTRTQLLGAAASTTQPAQKDPMGDKFASDMTAAYDDLCLQFPELARVKQLFSAVAVADGLRDAKDVPDLSLLLQKYQVAAVETPKTMKSLASEGQLMKITGGIELRALLLRLQDEDVTALREAVLRSRPDKSALSWPLPLSGWQLAGSESTVASPSAEADPKEQFKQLGVSINREAIRSALFSPPKLVTAQAIVPQPKVIFDQRAMSSQVPVQMPRVSPPIGGVMLSGTAHITNDGSPISLASGTFGLVVDGDNATYDLRTYQRFVTAVWAVYYCKEPPGISIDPVAQGVEKQLVRYIGRVVNTDLGRVMREADYTMKKWAIGTEKPDIPDFMDVDQLTASEGLNLLGASRRFWFVPEDIRFSRGEGLLVFQSGRMRLKTEYNEDGIRHKAEPADERFAEFFTAKYPAISKKYPIYDELFEYAKMVALARYLKEQGVPLHWFLLANRDLVLTEDSPGTVDTLAKGSKAIEGMRIEGGVEMGIQGRYVFDQETTKAVAKAMAQRRIVDTDAPQATTRPEVVTPTTAVSKDTPAYSLVPQHTLTSGRDRRGLRYQTDIALRAGTEPGLELVRYFRSYSESGGEFGNGWHLMIPYRIHPADKERRKFRNVMAPVRMTVENLLSGQQEVLTLDEERYSIVGYVPKDLATSQVIGLFPLTDATFRLADKLGNELQFDEAGYLTDMILGPEYQVHYEWMRGKTDAIARPGIQLKGVGERLVKLGQNLVPDKVALVDASGAVGETLVLSDDEAVVGYLPEKDRRDTSRIRIIAVRKDGAFELLNRDGHQANFTAAGNLSSLVVDGEHPLPAEMACGKQKVVFRYSLDVTGNLRIGSADISWPKQDEAYRIRYTYGTDGGLAASMRLPLD